MFLNIDHTVNKSEEFYQPAEWDLHRSTWLAWPSHGELWQDNLEPAQNEFVAFCEAICDLDPVSKKPCGECIDLLVPNEQAKQEAMKALGHLPVTYHDIPFGDIWLRDSAPIFVKNKSGQLKTVQFRFNGWGGKYDLPHDKEVAKNIAHVTGLPSTTHTWILEGGSVEVDGQGTILTTKQCLMNPNRNHSFSRKEMETRLERALGGTKVLWISEGLLNDHTDGHIDTLVRFYAPGKVLCMKAAEDNDPNADVLSKIESELREMTDAHGRKLEVHTITSPGRICDEEGKIMPASYLNFYISNTCVIVPTYGSTQDKLAVEMIAPFFPDRKTVGLTSIAILSGGGAFHCISQQEPV